MIGKSVPITIGFALLTAAGLIGSSLGTYDTFHILSGGDVLRSVLVTATVEGAIVFFAIWTLRANDDWTFAATLILTVFYTGLAVVFQVVNGYLHDSDGKAIAFANETIRWFIRNLVWIPPTVTAAVAFFVHVFDIRHGENRRPLMGGNRPN